MNRASRFVSNYFAKLLECDVLALSYHMSSQFRKRCEDAPHSQNTSCEI
jgi:hypothetical protein